MYKKIKSVLIGSALKSTDSESEKFSVLWGLPILSSDAISSVSYACEEILIVLIPVLGLASYKPLMGIAAAIVALLLILVFSYRQTIDSYPNGGGSYSVASDNLGHTAGLVAASSLSIGYVLTVAVSTCAGAAAITSAFPSLLPYKAPIAFVLIAFLTLGNLRGIRDSSILFGVPTYIFMAVMAVMITTGIVKYLVLGYVPEPAVALEMRQSTRDISMFLILKAFSSGCTALTGVEAVSNGVPNFEKPTQKNAKHVLVLVAVTVFIIFSGVCLLASLYQAVPKEDITVIAQIAAKIFGYDSVMFYVVQVSTAVILVMAANTSFADFPQLLSLLGQDGYAARRFASRGARLSFSNGIILLFGLASLLVFLFHGETHALMPLYAVGVFLAFTLSQTGMFRKWMKSREGRWRHKAFINGFGALVTAVTCVIIGVNKFAEGAWLVLICIPLLTLFMTLVKRHYNRVSADLSIAKSGSLLILKEQPEKHILLPIESVNKSFVKAFNYALTLGGSIEVYHVSTDPAVTEKVKKQFAALGTDAQLVIEEAPYRNVNETLLNHVDQRMNELKKHEMLTVVLPQFVIQRRWHYLLHNQTSLLLRSSLIKRRNVAIISIPYIIPD
ncbi:MAG TPA: amino acid permease [Ruminococcaceae bacterium]|jgi:amino acid transporter|nr:amino acid permease [Oscillospiraceae bacterium]